MRPSFRSEIVGELKNPLLGAARRGWWRVVDAADYAITLARLAISDWFFGPYPETEADRRRAEVARLKRLAEQGRRSGLSDEDGDAVLDRLMEKYRGGGKEPPPGRSA